MYKFEYKLNEENVKELNTYLAIHDEKIQKKVSSLIASFMIVIVIINLMIFKLSWLSVVICIVAFILCVIFIPKIYWKIIIERIDKVANEKEIAYMQTTVIFDDSILVKQGNKEYKYNYESIEHIDFTQNNCMLFCNVKGTFDKIVIPNNILKDDIEVFYNFLQKKRQVKL